VHPIERLRYVARAGDADPRVLVEEAAGALAAFGSDIGGLVTACRRLIARHPAAGPLWCLAARMLTSSDPRAAAREVLRELEQDRTARHVVDALPDRATVTVIGWPEQVASDFPRRGDVAVLAVDVDGEGAALARRLDRAGTDITEVPESGLGAAVRTSDLVLLDADATGPDGFVATAGSGAAAAVAKHAGVGVWVIAGAGRVLPAALWRAVVERLGGDRPWELPVEVVPLDLADHVVGPGGISTAGELTRRADCPVAPELIKQL